MLSKFHSEDIVKYGVARQNVQNGVAPTEPNPWASIACYCCLPDAFKLLVVSKTHAYMVQYVMENSDAGPFPAWRIARDRRYSEILFDISFSHFCMY